MIRVGICDDVEAEKNRIMGFCNRYFEKLSITCEFITFSSGEEVLEYKGELLYLLFLDIEMGDVDGIQVMKQLEERDNVWRIVFVTSHEEAVWETFGIKTLSFERKPISYESVARYLDIARKECRENVTVLFNKDDASSCVKLDSILYIGGDANYIRVHTRERNFIALGNLKKWENELKYTSMVRVHKSYLVNMYNISKIEQEIKFRNCDLKIPIGRKYKAEMKEIYQSYLMTVLRGRT